MKTIKRVANGTMTDRKNRKVDEMGMKEYIIKIDEDKKDIMGNCPLVEKPYELVRCKDCKHRPTDPENKGLGQSLVFPDDVCPCQIGDNWYSWMPKDDWFCADGERKETT